jgi:hypothetical protein
MQVFEITAQNAQSVKQAVKQLVQQAGFKISGIFGQNGSLPELMRKFHGIMFACSFTGKMQARKYRTPINGVNGKILGQFKTPGGQTFWGNITDEFLEVAEQLVGNVVPVVGGYVWNGEMQEPIWFAQIADPKSGLQCHADSAALLPPGLTIATQESPKAAKQGEAKTVEQPKPANMFANLFG